MTKQSPLQYQDSVARLGVSSKSNKVRAGLYRESRKTVSYTHLQLEIVPTQCTSAIQWL
jgi:hypothetical protein